MLEVRGRNPNNDHQLISLLGQRAQLDGNSLLFTGMITSNRDYEDLSPNRKTIFDIPTGNDPLSVVSFAIIESEKVHLLDEINITVSLVNGIQKFMENQQYRNSVESLATGMNDDKRLQEERNEKVIFPYEMHRFSNYLYGDDVNDIQVISEAIQTFYRSNFWCDATEVETDNIFNVAEAYLMKKHYKKVLNLYRLKYKDEDEKIYKFSTVLSDYQFSIIATKDQREISDEIAFNICFKASSKKADSVNYPKPGVEDNQPNSELEEPIFTTSQSLLKRLGSVKGSLNELVEKVTTPARLRAISLDEKQLMKVIILNDG
ncbi:hypothetical protein O9G_002723 [Rozella allomycis CSF55]|uniref:Uncharacterized protein n=1 Tax=Rozella allomycis (strain CSF55) TaxID=988480 RepID=A0A075AVB7_ROZAC|nr:hypothetical protein O9G_002723 [Rozella allomycis CSF55]|eukprot:EPZ32637.1 hypothetical protein O9G_002723 [Rozella allomycis CSF55]